MASLIGSETHAGAASRAEQLRTVRLEAIGQLAVAANIVDGASGVIAAICRNLRWECGMYWAAPSAGAALECVAVHEGDEEATAAFFHVRLRRSLRDCTALSPALSSRRTRRWACSSSLPASFESPTSSSWRP